MSQGVCNVLTDGEPPCTAEGGRAQARGSLGPLLHLPHAQHSQVWWIQKTLLPTQGRCSKLLGDVSEEHRADPASEDEPCKLFVKESPLPG